MFQKWFQTARKQSKTRLCNYKPRSLRLESLDSREMMSVTPLAALVGSSIAGRAACVASATPAVSTLTLPIGGIEHGKIGCRGETDSYTFKAKAGDTVQFSLATSGFNPYVKLYDPSGKDIGTMTYTGTTYSFSLAQSGEYTVKIRAANSVSTGSYAIGLERIGRPSPDAVSLPVNGSIASGKITSQLQKDQYTLQLKAGQQIQLSFAASGIDFYAKLYGPTGKDLMTMTVTHGTSVFTAGSAGTYTLQIQDWNLAKTGSYKIGVEAIYPTPSPDVKLLTPGQTASGAITTELQKNQYKVYLTAGQTMRFNFAGSGFDFYAKLYDPAGNGKMTMTRFNTPYDYCVQSSGWYILQIQDWNLLKTGAYTINAGLR
jgi:hypothetical protein